MADLKRQIIRDCLFGVDIEPEAIELAQLRLWLSLVLDLDPTEDPDPLPNLDFNLMVGNSLIDSIDGASLAPEHRETGKTLRMALDEGDTRTRRVIELKREFYATSDLPAEQREMHRQRIRAEEMVAIRKFWEARAGESMARVDELGKLHGLAGGLSKRETDELARQSRRADIYQRAAEAVASGDQTTRPFVYELEFADTFEEPGGFDIVIANPPYVSVQGSSGLPYREELGRRFTQSINGRQTGWVDDLYVHFVFRAFELARQGGVVCFITSDTYFTLQSKRRMRLLLHNRDLRVVAPCDPFNATVDAAVFLAFNSARSPEPQCEFDQMRYVPDEQFDRLSEEPAWRDGAALTVEAVGYQMSEWADGKLHRYTLDPRLWLGTQRMAVWEPSQRNSALYQRLILAAEPLLREWWEKIETSERYRRNRAEIERYLATLKPGDITLLGLVADGGQGLATANNGRFLAYREDSPNGRDTGRRRRGNVDRWRTHATYGRLWDECLAQANGDECAAIDLLRGRVGDDRKLGLGKGELYKTVRSADCLESDDLDAMSDDDLEQVRYAGITDSVRHWVPYRKGDREGRRWWAEEPLYVDWSMESVAWLKENAHKRISNSPRWQNPHLFFRWGVTWERIGRDVPLKARMVAPSVLDTHASFLTTSNRDSLDEAWLCAYLNWPTASHVLKRFVNNTNYEMNDIRSCPVVIPEHADIVRCQALWSSARNGKVPTADDSSAALRGLKDLSFPAGELEL